MDDKRKGFTFIWKIQNFSFSFNQTATTASPVFCVHSIRRSNWTLYLFSKPNFSEGCFVCGLVRLPSYVSWDNYQIDYELAFLTDDGSVIQSEIFLKKTFEENEVKLTSLLKASRNDVFVLKKHLFLTDDTLTVRCRMWKSEGIVSESVRCFVKTRFITESRSVIGGIGNFSSLKASSKNKVCVKSSEKLASMNLCIDDNGKLDFEIELLGDYNPSSMYKFNVFMLDVIGNKVKFCHGETYDKKSFCIPVTFSKQRLIENKEHCIPNDVLTLHCEVISLKSSKDQLDTIDYMVYEYDCQDIQAVNCNTTSAHPSSEEQENHISSTLKDDFISLFREGKLSDVKLKTATETFSAHTAVLGARSPVFNSMFATDMREKTNHCVVIDDLKADAVRQMLIFMYSDILDDPDYEQAKSLYYAADKYSIISLRHRCSKILTKNLLYSNCCDVLLLADKHQDEDLKRSVQDWIAENDEAVFSRVEWKNLMETQPKLTTEILFALHMKNRRT